jgi:hypothetical protein
MHCEIKEMLIGSVSIILFGVAIIAWPPLALFIERYVFSYLRLVLQWVPFVS